MSFMTTDYTYSNFSCTTTLTAFSKAIAGIVGVVVGTTSYNETTHRTIETHYIKIVACTLAHLSGDLMV